MFNKTFLSCLIMTFSAGAYATQVPVMGNVESKCVVTQDVVGVFGNPQPGTLSTNPSDGGVMPIVRYDVVQASYYTARITHPNSFAESPALSDVVYWEGDTTVAQVSDPLMSDSRPTTTVDPLPVPFKPFLTICLLSAENSDNGLELAPNSFTLNSATVVA